MDFTELHIWEVCLEPIQKPWDMPHVIWFTQASSCMRSDVYIGGGGGGRLKLGRLVLVENGVKPRAVTTEDHHKPV